MHKVIKSMKDPRWLIAVLWPVVLAVPYLPGIPRPALGGLAWRQELLLAILLVVTAALMLGKRRTGSYSVLHTPGSMPLFICGGLFTLWIAASILWAANPYSVGHNALTWGAYLIFFLLMRMVAARPRALRTLFFALGTVIWLLSISCVIEWLGGAALTDRTYRNTVKPLFRGFSGFTEVMAIASPIFGALALSVRKQRLAILCGATALVAWVAIIQANQRASTLGALAAFAMLAAGMIFLRRCRPRNLQRAITLFGGFILVAVVQLAIFPPTQGEDFSVLQRLQNTSPSEANTSVRLLYWGVGLEMFRANPLIGVGANNYGGEFGPARERFSAKHPGSALLGMNEQLLTQYAHNEYVQILAELGLVGILLFGVFGVLVARTLWQALRRARQPLPALGAGAGLLAFAASSGASAFSFRWLGSGLMFFFAAALVSHFAASATIQPQSQSTSSTVFGRFALAGVLAFAILMLVGAGMQGTNSVMHALAQSSNSPARAEDLYRQALRFNQFDAATHFDYGSLLYHQRRYNEAVPHLSYAIRHGLNTSTSYAALAAAQEQNGDIAASEQTLAAASRAYPNSIFLLVRHSAALSRMGNSLESEQRLAAAVARDARSARGWYQLINFDIDAALIAAEKDSSLAKPGELKPYTAVYVVLKENERRLNIPANSGWRGRIRPALN